MGQIARLDRHQETRGVIAAPVATVFAYVDDPAHLSAHMERSSWMMGGGRMTLAVDAGGGRAIGSHVTLAGGAFGIALSLEEVVIERSVPHRKTWQTIGVPNLLVVGPYRMGFEVSAHGEGALLRVFIDYALPPAGIGRWLGRLFGPLYALWCTRRMVRDAVLHFEGGSHGRRTSSA